MTHHTICDYCDRSVYPNIYKSEFFCPYCNRSLGKIKMEDKQGEIAQR